MSDLFNRDTPTWLAKARRRAAAHHGPLPSQGAVYDRHQLLAAYDAQAAALATTQARAEALEAAAVGLWDKLQIMRSHFTAETGKPAPFDVAHPAEALGEPQQREEGGGRG